MVEDFRIENPTGKHVALSEVIINGAWRLVFPGSVRLHDIYKIIPGIPLYHNLKKDELIGKHTHTGDFSIKSASNSLIQYTPVSWTNFVWFEDQVPRFSFIRWMLGINQLPTHDRLVKWGITNEKTCYIVKMMLGLKCCRNSWEGKNPKSLAKKLLITDEWWERELKSLIDTSDDLVFFFPNFVSRWWDIPLQCIKCHQ